MFQNYPIPIGMAKQNWWRRWLNWWHASSRPRAVARRLGCRLRLEELEGRWVPATVQFNAASEVVNETAGTFSIPVSVTDAGVASTFASGFSNPRALAFNAGNLYVANYSANTVSQVTPAGVVSTFVPSTAGLNGPDGLAFDSAGNLYVTNLFSNTVSKVTPAGNVTTFASGFDMPFGLAFDALGNLYVANSDETINTVSKVTSGGVVSTFAAGFRGPLGLAFDAAGNLYVANGAGTVSKVTSGGVVSPFAAGFSGPEGLAFDAAGNLYVANNTGKVSEVNPGGVVSTFASGFDTSDALAFDAAGNLYVTNDNFNPDTVSKVTVPSVSVPFTLGGTATAGTDYSGVSASPLVIPAGQTSATISGTLLPDLGPNQTLTLTLGTPTGATLGTPAVNTLTIRESVLAVQGTSGNDTFIFSAGSPSFYVLNGVATTVPARYNTVVFVGNGGIDHAEVYGSGNDTATFTPTIVTDMGSGYTVELDNVAVANVHSSGVNSSATFTLGAGDIFVGRYDYSQMVQAHNTYYLGAIGFHTTTGNAVTGLGSEAWMATSPTSSTDTMTGTATGTTIQGPGYSSTANNFSFVAAFAGNTSNATATLSTTPNEFDILGGVPSYSFVQDSSTEGGAVLPYVIYAVSFPQVQANGDTSATAYLATSNGSTDTYVGTPTSGEVKGMTYDIQALGFGRVYAYAGGTGSVAHLTTDNFVGGPSNSESANYTDIALGFANVIATASSSSSTATFYDAPGNNTFTGTGSSAEETGSGYAVTANGFSTVNLDSFAGGGNDQANVSNITYTLNKSGNWQ